MTGKRARFAFNFVIKQIGEYTVMLPVGETSFSGIIRLNPPSAFLVEQLKTACVGDAVTAYSRHFQLPDDKALQDCCALLDALRQGGIIRELY